LLQSGLSRLTEWIENAQTDKEQQATEKKRLENERIEIVEKIRSSSKKPYEKAVVQETSELLHYVVQRLMLTFNDEFKIAFNPSVLSQNADKDQVKTCLEELLDAMKFQLAQELRATTLRIERHVHTQREQFYKMITDSTAQKSHYDFMELEDAVLETPAVKPNWNPSTVTELVPSLKRFKNPKQFFEGNGREILREELSEKFEPELKNVVEKFTNTFSEFYEDRLSGELDQLKERMSSEIDQYYGGLIDAFGSKEQFEKLVTKKANLEAIIQRQERIEHE
jgi:hypothetical protein